MNKSWQPTIDPLDLLIDLRQRVTLLEHNQQAIIQAQNDIGQSMRQLIEQHNQLIELISREKT